MRDFAVSFLSRWRNEAVSLCPVIFAADATATSPGPRERASGPYPVSAAILPAVAFAVIAMAVVALRTLGALTVDVRITDSHAPSATWEQRKAFAEGETVGAVRYRYHDGINIASRYHVVNPLSAMKRRG
jgi:hypothetical protein